MPFQFTDPDVSHRKFDREIAEFKELGDQYRKRGWFLVKADYPEVLVIFAAPQVKPPVVVLGVLLDYTNYDAIPPSVRLVDPFSGTPYKFRELPTQLNRLLPQQQLPLQGLPPQLGNSRMVIRSTQPYMQASDPEEIPFLCVAGTREYHENPAHNGDLWELHRTQGAGRLVRLLEIVSRYGIQPITGLEVQLVPQITVNYGMPAE